MSESRTEGQVAGEGHLLAVRLGADHQTAEKVLSRSPVWGTGEDWGFHTGTSSTPGPGGVLNHETVSSKCKVKRPFQL